MCAGPWLRSRRTIWGDCPEEFLSFFDVEDECLEEYKTGSTGMIRCPDGSRVWPWDDRFRVPGEFGIGNRTHKVPEDQGYEKVEVAFTEQYPTFGDFMTKYHSYEKDPERGRYGYWENPNSKWDWYAIGGRWTGFFKLKEGATGNVGSPGLMTDAAEPGWVDSARKKDIDFDAMVEAAGIKAAERWDEKMGKLADMEFAGTPITPEILSNTMWMLGASDNSTRAEYIEDCRKNAIGTFAVLKDGNWFERGEMGWWGVRLQREGRVQLAG